MTALPVLLVDDQPLVHRVMVGLLADVPDLALTSLTDPGQALPWVLEHQPAVILVDWNMPGMSGLQLLDLLQSHDAVSRIPVVILSVEENAGVKSEAFRHGASDYLVKMPEREELVARLRHHAAACLATRRLADTEARLQRNGALLDCVNRLHRRFLADTASRATFDPLLGEILELTGSQYGFIAALEDGEMGERAFLLLSTGHRLSDPVHCAFFQRAGREQIRFARLDALYAAPFLARQPVVVQDPGSDPRAAGLPPGHPPLEAFLGLPLMQGREVVGVMGLANRPGGYGPEMIAELEVVVAATAQIVSAFRTEEKRRQAEEEVRSINQKLEERVEERTAKWEEANRRLREEVVERRQAEEERDRFFLLSPDMMVVLDREGGILRTNPALLETLAISPEEVTGRPFLDWVAEEDREAVLSTWDRCLAGERVRNFPMRLRHRQGSFLWSEWSVVARGQRVYAVGRDITAHREAEALRREKQAAEAANQAKSAFLATMSHEIRTPLHAVLGVNEMLMESPLDEDQRRFLGISLRSGRALVRVIDDILDLSRIEAGLVPFQEQSFHLPSLLREALDLFLPQAEVARLGLFLAVDEHLPEWVWGDPERLRQVLIHLLGNAVKFTRRGAVSLEVKEDSPGRIRFAVRDTGMGIPPDKIAVIFQPFLQLDGATTRSFGGTGLGLTLACRLVERMGGKISVESTPGDGSLFHFILPLPASAPPRPKESPVGLPEENDLLPLQLLLVDDSEENRLLLNSFLKKTPHRLECLVNGAEAVSAFTPGRWDLILMDIEMPVMDGYAATRAIRSREKNAGARPTPIIALTAHAMKEDARRAMEAGCDLHVTKPMSKRMLLELLREWAGSNPARTRIVLPG